jgi:hypothetical protein
MAATAFVAATALPAVTLHGSVRRSVNNAMPEHFFRMAGWFYGSVSNLFSEHFLPLRQHVESSLQ